MNPPSSRPSDRPRSHGSPSPALAAMIVIGMLAMLAIPAALTLHSVTLPGTFTVGENPSPHGYTWSLLLFLVPIATIGLWFLPSEGLQIPQRAFWRTIAVLVPFGWGLDFLFAQWFFCYPNKLATLDILAPALGPWVPIEEYVFYLTGFIAVLLFYIWLSEYWVAAYSVPDYPGQARSVRRLLQFHPTSLVLALALIGAAWFYKKHGAPLPERDGFPGYFTFLVGLGLTPSVSFYPLARKFINWRAFSLTLFFMLLISLLWEATLALPYGWWNFQHKQMMGLFIGAWDNLPIEEIFVWIAVTYATIIIFEVVKVWQASGRRAKDAFLGLGSEISQPESL